MKPEEKLPWDERWRRNQLVVVAVAVLAVMAAFSILREFFTTTLPWLVGFVGPVGAAFVPVSRWLSENAEAVSTFAAPGIVLGVVFAVMYRGLRDEPRRPIRWHLLLRELRPHIRWRSVMLQLLHFGEDDWSQPAAAPMARPVKPPRTRGR